MRLASMPIAVLMQRRTLNHKWASEAWAATGVVGDPGGLPLIVPLSKTDEQETYLVSGLELQLFPDEDEGYFENCIAPQPKVFILWRMQDERAMPIKASVSYADGTRMFDSGEAADGVMMPAEVHAWLSAYLAVHYKPRENRRRHRS